MMSLRFGVATITIAAALTAGVAHARDVPVSTAAELSAAIAAAAPGDVITIADGTYEFTGASCSRAASEIAPVVVRGKTHLGARIRMDALEGFKVSAPGWHFEDLDIQGVCANDSDCEHAFHVTGLATGFVMRNNRISDFNAQLKVNADGNHNLPNGGLVENNELFDTHARSTSNPVTKLNIDQASHWVVRANLIYDFHKGGGDSVSYGAFHKGGVQGPVFERNLVLCTRNDTTGGTRIGLSFGGGGMDPALCVPGWSASVPCDPEAQDGVMRNNIIANCSDVGIYLNKAKNTRLLHNTLIATAGIDFRFAGSTGEAHGNVLASAIRARDTGSFTGADNLAGVTDAQFAAFYVDPLKGDLRKNGDLTLLIDKGGATANVTDDYCARSRTDGKFDWGALEHSLGDCVTTVPTGAAPAATDAGADANAEAGSAGGGAGGAAGSGGASGAGGATSTGGAAGSGGATSTGGAAGSGGASGAGGATIAGAGGTQAAGGAPPSPAPAPAPGTGESSGCGCRTSRAAGSAAWIAAALALVLSAARWRTRRR
jgi:parallel beta-helix repeat protein